ncbi:HesB/IscA family protein [Anaplasma phagocytophilum]|uniref:HesB/IscA family protein n=1 Tax=Anaplasma phagocytophilum TaxID=948 RepID=UPI0007E065F1|nr:iron-sulfur cluster assembly accessory protein [Anaplasma phagocytophilum]SBO29901.1 Iron-binding protein IscA [Anaplasma phagocytophilum]SBO29902.1 Iron-binding protein IscA [Anaplasma phagocytophilum]SBO30194.1 Iron-binding protein IscA [Anaplasma phagocytophilum]SCV63068.1 Iron-binding protein IscA [Anaplasma phagocytophilum]
MDNSAVQNMDDKGREVPVVVTDAALRRMKELLLAKGDEAENVAIRILIKQKGCYGLKYHIEYAYDVRPLEVKVEKVIDEFSVTILIEPKAMMFIRGTVIDYYSDKLSSGFTFKNPNEKGRCGCGESFYV